MNRNGGIMGHPVSTDERNQGTYYIYLNVRLYLKIKSIETVEENPKEFLSFVQLVETNEGIISRPVYTVAKSAVSYYYRVSDDMVVDIEESTYKEIFLNDHYTTQRATESPGSAVIVPGEE